MNAQKQVLNTFRDQNDLVETVGRQVQSPVRIASEDDLLINPAISPARQYQAFLEQAWEEPQREPFSLGARVAIIAGGSAALWVAIAWVIYLAVR
jgi:hypothetical protein